MKSNSKHTKRQPYWFSKCSGIPAPLAWRYPWCTWLEDKWTAVTKTSIRRPFQVHARPVSRLLSSCSAGANAALASSELTNNMSDTQECRHQVRQRPLQLSVTINLLIANLKPF